MPFEQKSHEKCVAVLRRKRISYQTLVVEITSQDFFYHFKYFTSFQATVLEFIRWFRNL